jgi:hypothetical protein
MKYKIWTFTFTTLFVLSGCGAGGEDWASKDPSAIAISTNSFDIASGWTKLLKTGYTKTLVFSQPTSTCGGLLQILQTPVEIDDVTNSQYMYKNNLSYNEQYTSCSNQTTRPTLNVSQYNWYSSNYSNSFVSVNNQAGNWDVPAVFPSAVRVGEQGAIGQFTNSDGTTGAPAGIEKWTYRIEMDTATTAKFRLTMSANDDRGEWLGTEENLFRVGPDNSLMLISVLKRYPSGFHLEAK